MALEPIVPGSGGYTPGYNLPPIPITQGVPNVGFSLGGLGGVLSSGIDYFSAKDTNRKQKKLAREQMQFQERLSNTAYQRAVKDMRAAGINPMLAYAQGGASTPSGAQAQLRAPQVGEKAVRGLDVGSKVTQRKLQNRNIVSQNKLIDSQTNQTDAQAAQGIANARTAKVVADFAEKNPEIYPLMSTGGTGAAVGGAISSAKGLGNYLKRLFGRYGK